MGVAGHHMPVWFDEDTEPTDGQVVAWNASRGRFEPVSGGGGGGGVQTIDGNAPDEAGDVDLSVTYVPIPAGAPTPGQVLSATDDDPLTTDWIDAGGSTPAGVPIVRAFPFAFDTPDLLTGAALYTPTVGDVLIDVWLEVVTPWDGTTPKCDVGMFSGQEYGWWGNVTTGAPILLMGADSAYALSDPGMVAQTAQGGNAPPASGLSAWAAFNSSGDFGNYRVLPAKFATTDPVKVVVSQDGKNTGADPGSAQGSAILYLVTATPA